MWCGGRKATDKFITSHSYRHSRKLLTRLLHGNVTQQVATLHINVVHICRLDTHISFAWDQSSHSCAINWSTGQVSRKLQPKALQLDAEGGAVPHTGPVINSYFSMMARVWRHEVRLCFQLTAYFAYCALAGCPRLLQGLQYVLQMFMTQWNLSSIHSAHPNEYILRNFINRNLHGSFQPATWQLQRA